MRYVALILGLLLVGSPGWAQFGAFGSKQRRDEVRFQEGGLALTIFDADCTDLYDTPSTSDGTVVTDENNFDTLATAVDVLGNLGDSVQTSGSPDGWCDATPWVIKGTIITATAENLFIGPFLLPAKGVILHSDFGTIGTSYQFDWVFNNSWDANSTVLSTGASRADNATYMEFFGPAAVVTSGEVDGTNLHPIPYREVYLKVVQAAAASWAMDLAILPVR